MYKAFTGHVTGNLWLWTAIGLGIAVLAMFGIHSFGNSYYLAEILTLGAMFGATTMILISQKGMVHAVPVEDETA